MSCIAERPYWVFGVNKSIRSSLRFLTPSQYLNRKRSIKWIHYILLYQEVIDNNVIDVSVSKQPRLPSGNLRHWYKRNLHQESDTHCYKREHYILTEIRQKKRAPTKTSQWVFPLSNKTAGSCLPGFSQYPRLLWARCHGTVAEMLLSALYGEREGVRLHGR